MALARVHNTPADGTFSPTGETAWEEDHAITGATSGGIPYFSSDTTEASSLLLTAGAIVIGGGAATAPYTSSKLTESATAGAGLTIAAGTATTAVSPLTITQTWNDAGTTFDGIVLDVTNTASGSSSTLFNFKVGGVSQLRYQRNNGALVFATGNISGLTSLSLYNTGYYEWTGRCYIDSGTTANIALHDNAGTSFGLLQFGGTSSSFPAIKRSTTTLQARLADDSAYATFDGKFAASGAAGANFGPGVVTSITVVDGIVTAIS